MTDPECERPVRLDCGPELPLPVDTLFDVLSDWRRRRVLWYLDERAEAVAVADLAALLADDPNATGDSETVEVSLAHAVLPRLSAEGLVAYDRGDDRASLTESGAELSPYVAYARRLDATVDE